MLYGCLNTSQLASFIYRWYILHYTPPSKARILILIWVLAMPNIVLFSFCSVSFYFFKSLYSWFARRGTVEVLNLVLINLHSLVLQLPLVFNNWAEDYREMVLKFYPEEADSSIATFGVPEAYTDLKGSLPTFGTSTPSYPSYLLSSLSVGGF